MPLSELTLYRIRRISVAYLEVINWQILHPALQNFTIYVRLVMT